MRFYNANVRSAFLQIDKEKPLSTDKIKEIAQFVFEGAMPNPKSHYKAHYSLYNKAWMYLRKAFIY